jgi:hypothetical protein
MSWLVKFVVELIFRAILEMVYTAIKSVASAYSARPYSKRRSTQELLKSDAEKKEQAHRVFAEAKRRRAPRVSGAPAAAVQASTAPADCPECRAYNPPESAFCGECGAAFGIPAA